MAKLTGIPASPGVAIGRVFPVDRRRARVPRYHIQPEQVPEEFAKVVRLVQSTYSTLGITEYGFRLSAHDPSSDKYVANTEMWARAEAQLRTALQEMGTPFTEAAGEAAFYGPKISVQARDAIGRTWQMSTIQLDFNLPERFELEYQAADGTRRRPVMIHRALFGSIERFFGVLVEHYAGAFPAWLAPVQVVGIPVHSDYDGYLLEVAAKLRAQGIRVEVDTSDDRMQKKIRTAQRSKVPFMLIAGEDDVTKDAVSFRYRDGTQENGVPLDEAVAKVVAAVEARA